MRKLYLKTMYIPEEIHFNDCMEYFSLISPSRQDKIRKFHFDRDKLISLATELLVRYCISKDIGVFPEQLEFEYGEYGKPYISCIPDYFFSVSHSHNAIIFASSDSEIGVDIEKITEDSKSVVQIAKDFFTCDEAKYICSSDNNMHKRFFEVWTRKEAYVKRLGTGLYTPLDSFSVLKEYKEDKFVTFQEKEYMISVCCDIKYNRVSSEHISFGRMQQFYKAKEYLN